MLVTLAACANAPAKRAGYDVEIRRTALGIAHVRAADYGSLGYGYGYAQAQDALCTMADGFLTWRGERSAAFGAQARPPASATFGRPRNLDADFFFRFMLDAGALQRFRAAQSTSMRELVTGFAAGYDRYLDEVRAGRHAGAHAACVGQPWLRPIDADDVYRRMMAIGLAGGASRFLENVVNARPPGPAALRDTPPSTREPDPQQAVTARLTLGGRSGIGSNAMVFGANSTREHRSLLFGNPHWFWQGADRFYPAQLTLPTQLDVAGVSFLGAPVIVLGFNHDVAWTHTVSSARRFGVFQLSLLPGTPTRYRYDDGSRELQAVPLTVQVKGAPGEPPSEVRRVLYRSAMGPVVDLSAFSPALRWNAQQAFVLRDVNADNTGVFDNFLAWGQARSLDAFIAIQRERAATPWVNTFAIGRGDPRVWFADIGAVPNVSDALADACTTPLGRAARARLPGVPFLDGSRSFCQWHGSEYAPGHPERLPVAAMPSLLRNDYLGNFNGSYWLTHPSAPLHGMPRIMGQTGVEQSLRTRLGHAMAARLQAAPGGVERSALQQAVLDSESMAARVYRPALLASICAHPADATLRQGCAVLRAWDGTANPEARGADLWDAFWRRAATLPAAQQNAQAFDAAQPLVTPAGYANTRATRRALSEALRQAVRGMQQAGQALDAARGETLYAVRGNAHIPLYGGCHVDGYFTAACHDAPADEGPGTQHADVYGNSYLQLVDFDAQGPRADIMFAPSISDDPASPHWADATRAYSAKRWQRFAFSDAAQRADPNLQRTWLHAPR